MASEQRLGRNQGESQSNAWEKSPPGNGSGAAGEGGRSPQRGQGTRPVALMAQGEESGVFPVSCILTQLLALLPSFLHLLPIPSPVVSPSRSVKV